MILDVKSNELKFEKFLTNWIDNLKNILGYSEHTYNSYKRDIRDFQKFLSSQILLFFGINIQKIIIK